MRFGQLYQDLVLAPLAEQLLSAVQVGAKAGSVVDVLADGGVLTQALVSATSFDVEAGLTAVDLGSPDPQLAHLATLHPLKVGSCSADHLPFADDSFDAAFNLLTLGWANAEAMVGEMVRVTKPGGVVAILKYNAQGATHEQILADAYAEATSRLDTFSRYLFADVDFHRMRSQIVREILRFHGADHFLDVMMQGRNMGANLSSTEIAALRAATAKRLEPHTVADGTIRMPVDVEIVTLTT